MGRAHLRNLIYFHEVDKGEHFAAWEQAELFAAEVGAAFRSLRSQVPGRRAPDRSPSQMAMRQLIWKEQDFSRFHGWNKKPGQKPTSV